MHKFASLALAAAAIAAAPAAAQSESESYMLFVPYGDLNLATSEGSKALEGRVKATANRVCGPTLAPGLAEARRVASCRSGILSAARPQVERALAERSGSSITIRAVR